MNRLAALLGAATALPVVIVPLTLPGPLSLAWELPIAVLLAVAGVLSPGFDEGRTLVALGLAGWALTVLGFSEQRSVPAAVACAIALRAWAAVPELLRLGRDGAHELAVDLVGGGAAAGLVVVAPDSVRQLPPEALLLALAALGALMAAALRLRR